MTNQLQAEESVDRHLHDIFILDKNYPGLKKSLARNIEIPLKEFVVPPIPEEFDRLQLFTEIKVYNQHSLAAYESGLTAPLGFKLDSIQQGDRISFTYQISHNPGLKIVKL